MLSAGHSVAGVVDHIHMTDSNLPVLLIDKVDLTGATVLLGVHTANARIEALIDQCLKRGASPVLTPPQYVGLLGDDVGNYWLSPQLPDPGMEPNPNCLFADGSFILCFDHVLRYRMHGNAADSQADSP